MDSSAAASTTASSTHLYHAVSIQALSEIRDQSIYVKAFCGNYRPEVRQTTGQDDWRKMEHDAAARQGTIDRVMDSYFKSQALGLAHTSDDCVSSIVEAYTRRSHVTICRDDQP